MSLCKCLPNKGEPRQSAKDSEAKQARPVASQLSPIPE